MHISPERVRHVFINENEPLRLLNNDFEVDISKEIEYIAELANLIIYSDEQVTVWTYEEYPQFLINLDGESVVPLTAENAGEIIPYEETTLMGKFKGMFK